MRIHIELPDALAEQAREEAQASGRTLASLVEDGLRRVLATSGTASVPRQLPEYGDPNARPLVDLAHHDAVADVLDADGPR